MAFNIVFKKNLSEANKVDKVFYDNGLSLSGTLKDSTSIIDPIIIVSGTLTDFAGYNYMTIDSFNRSYFITDMISITNTLIEVHAHVDVLSTYKAGIRSNSAIIKKQQNSFNKYLNDGTFKTYQNPKIVTKNFPAGFNTQEFVLAIAGS